MKLVDVTGRPKEFDEAKVLDHAMRQFWTHGFEGSTLRDLQAATELSSQSIYNSFGGKRGLIIGAVDHYIDVYLSKLLALISGEEDPIEAVRIPIAFYRDRALDEERPGCFLANALVECGQDPEISTHCRRGISGLREAITQRLEEAKAAGFLSDHGSPRGIAAAINNTLVGLATMACGQIEPDEIAAIFDGIMSLFQSVVKPAHW